LQVTRDARNARPLTGVRVVDLTTSLAGPYCTLILGALGADVVKIERPGTGDDTRAWGPPFWGSDSAMFLAMNASKRSIAVDLKSPDGIEIVKDLVARADVFVENLRPGAAGRLGLGFDPMRERNPRIVYCSISAFGTTGPLAERPGYDPLMQAASGIMSVTGDPAGAAARAGVSLVDQGTGLWAAVGVLAALQTVRANGEAQLVTTSLYEVALAWMNYHLVGHLATGFVPGPQGSGMPMLAPYEAFECSDGPLMIAVGNDRLFALLCESLDMAELASDPRFATNADRVVNRVALSELVAERVRRQTRRYWLGRFEDAGIPAAPVQDVQEAVADPQTQALGIVEPMDHPVISEFAVVQPPVTIQAGRVRHQRRPPVLGEHTSELLTELGRSDAEILELGRQGVVQAPIREVRPPSGPSAAGG
jgi:crotonobetainyl-CoA:carnitine CoA-transferase CaiB-like acyl-CoA transferase